MEDKERRLTAALRSMIRPEPGGPSHLSYEQIEGFVDGSLAAGERLQADSHLQICPRCAQEVADLRRVADAYSESTGIPQLRARGRAGLDISAPVPQKQKQKLD